MWNLKYDTNELIYKTQTYRHRKQTYGYQRGKGGRVKLGVWDQQIQATVYKIDKQQVLLYSTGNYIQYPLINHSGKEYEKEYIYMYN